MYRPNCNIKLYWSKISIIPYCFSSQKKYFRLLHRFKSSFIFLADEIWILPFYYTGINLGKNHLS